MAKSNDAKIDSESQQWGIIRTHLDGKLAEFLNEREDGSTPEFVAGATAFWLHVRSWVRNEVKAQKRKQESDAAGNK